MIIGSCLRIATIGFLLIGSFCSFGQHSYHGMYSIIDYSDSSPDPASNIFPRDLFSSKAVLGVAIYLDEGTDDHLASHKQSYSYIKPFIEDLLKQIGFEKLVFKYFNEENYKADGNVQLTLMNEGATHYMPIKIKKYPKAKQFAKGKATVDSYTDFILWIHPITEEYIEDYDYYLGYYPGLYDIMGKLATDIKKVPGGYFINDLTGINEGSVNADTSNELLSKALLKYPDDLDNEVVLLIKKPESDPFTKEIYLRLEKQLIKNYPFEFRVLSPQEYEIGKDNFKYVFGHITSGFELSRINHYVMEIESGLRYYGQARSYNSLENSLKAIIKGVREKYQVE